MLLNKKDVINALRCPRSGNSLKPLNNKLFTKCSEKNIEYEIVDGYPILIDFEQSVLKREEIKSLSSVIERNKYSSVLIGVKKLLFPTRLATIENVEETMDLLLDKNDSARVLIIGGGTIGEGMIPFYKDPRIELVAFDIYASPWVQFLADAHNIPLPDSSFDAVIIQAVLEHVLEPSKVVSEIYRVLKIDGIVYAETPFLQHVHEGAYDFTRFTESGHRYLFRKFELIKSGVSAGSGTQLLWALDNFARGLFRSRKLGKIIMVIFFWLPYCDKIIPSRYNIDSASGVFFLGKKQLSEIDSEEIITHYKGAQ